MLRASGVRLAHGNFAVLASLRVREYSLATALAVLGQNSRRDDVILVEAKSCPGKVYGSGFQAVSVRAAVTGDPVKVAIKNLDVQVLIIGKSGS